MSNRNNLTVNCPTCKRSLAWDPQNPHRPFCSERCKLMDLGAWANEDYRIPAEPSDSRDPEEEAVWDDEPRHH